MKLSTTILCLAQATLVLGNWNLLSTVSFEETYDLDHPAEVEATVSNEHCESREDVVYAGNFCHGGITNVMERMYNSIRQSYVENTTYLLPWIRNDGCTIPLEGHPSKYVQMDYVFDTEHFCSVLERSGVCVECSNVPLKLKNDTMASVRLYPETLNESYCGKDAPWVKEREYEGLKFHIGVYQVNPKIAKSPPFQAIAQDEDSVPFETDKIDAFAKFAVKALRPNELLEKRIKKVQAKLGDKYLALHMRIEEEWADDWTNGGSCYITADHIVEAVTSHPDYLKLKKEVSGKDGQNKLKVFVATGEKAMAREAWEKVPGVEFIGTEDIVEDLGLAQRAYIDMQLSTRSSMWVGAKVQSSFSILIESMRRQMKLVNHAYSKSNSGSEETLFGKWDDVDEFQCFS